METNKHKNKQTKKLYHKTRLFTCFFLLHSTKQVISAITILLSLFYSYLLMLTHFILIILSHSTSQTSSWLSFSGGEFENNQISPMHLFGIINNGPFQRQRLYRLLFRLVSRFAFFLFPHLFFTYMTKLSVDSPGFPDRGIMYIWQRTQ